jgi:hypothetical protein
MSKPLRRLPVSTLALLLVTVTAHAEPFTFVALGDTAYNGERDYPVYRALIQTINRSKPAFSIHVGDVWGLEPCGEPQIARVSGFFALHDHPLIYTPGDNEWTDCWARLMGGYDPAERLQRLRTAFFKDKWSLGQHPITLVRQSTASPRKRYAENARWSKDEVLFFTVNVPGSNNNYRLSDLPSMTEATQRIEADVAWIRDSFRIAREQRFKAVVMAYHAEMFDDIKRSDGPFSAIIHEIRIAATRFDGQILLIHGDAHRFTIDRPLLELRGESEPSLYANVTRLQVYGAPEIKAVQVTVDTTRLAVFGFTPLY